METKYKILKTQTWHGYHIEVRRTDAGDTYASVLEDGIYISPAEWSSELSTHIEKLLLKLTGDNR